MAKTQIFRKVAMERLASPEQLDQLMQVTTPKGWLALAAIAGLLLAAAAWSIVGSIPERVAGQAILLRSGGVFEVVSQSGGRLTDVAVRVGDVIAEGKVVARLEQPELSERIRHARARVTELEVEVRRVEALIAQDARLQATVRAQRRANIEASIAAAERALNNLRSRLETQRRLVIEGLLTRQTLLNTQQEHDATAERIRASKAELAQLDVQMLETQGQRQERAATRRAELAAATRELERLESDLRIQSAVISPYSGRVLEVMAEQGSIIDRGKSLLTLSLTGNATSNLEAVVYVPSIHGKKVRPGMNIEIVPATVRREEFGYLLGRVTYVSDFPATPAGMQRVLKNSTLVQVLSRQDTPYEVHADLMPDPSSPSQYRWSSSRGPPTHIESGTIATANIVVNRLRPILMVIPQLGRAFAAEPATGGDRADGGR